MESNSKVIKLLEGEYLTDGVKLEHVNEKKDLGIIISE